MSLVLPLLLLILQISPSGPAEEDPCAEGRISHVFIDNHSIFDPEALPEDARIRWAYELANRIHMRTRTQVIERELLLSGGDCFDAALARESARVLREFRFIADADVFGVDQPDGSTHLLVDTRDEWTTKLTLGIRFDQGVQFEGVALTEENFLGRGVSVGAFFLLVSERGAAGPRLEIPRIGPTYWDVRAAAAATRIGERFDQALVRPFRGEQPGTAVRQELFHRRDFFNYVLPGEPRAMTEDELSHVVLPLREQLLQVGMSHRSTALGGGLLLGGGLSYERIQVGAPERAGGIAGSDFGERLPLDSALAARLLPQVNSRRALRLNLSAGFREIRFQAIRGLDAVAGIQDLPLGREIIFTGGRTLGSTGAERPADVHFRLNAFRGGQVGPVLSFVTFTGESRRELGRQEGRAWRDGLGELQSFSYWRPAGAGSPTVVLRAAAQGGWRSDSPFQLTLGGPDGVRGYSENDFPGGRRAIVSAEGRWALPNPLADLADLGMTLFGDAGRMWAGDVPFGQDTGWRTTLGAGLRLGFPPGSSSIIRLDVAIPMDGGVSRSPVFRISSVELLGLLDDPRSRQLLRSRRSGLSADYSSIVRERRPPG